MELEGALKSPPIAIERISQHGVARQQGVNPYLVSSAGFEPCPHQDPALSEPDSLEVGASGFTPRGRSHLSPV